MGRILNYVCFNCLVSNLWVWVETILTSIFCENSHNDDLYSARGSQGGIQRIIYGECRLLGKIKILGSIRSITRLRVGSSSFDLGGSGHIVRGVGNTCPCLI